MYVKQFTLRPFVAAGWNGVPVSFLGLALAVRCAQKMPSGIR
jgi:hypothetical protein